MFGLRNYYPHHRLGRSFWDVDYPESIFDQWFGLEAEPESHLPVDWPFDYSRRGPVRRPKTGTGKSTVRNDADKFQINLDVNQFKPEELTVKVKDNSVLIEGKHEERPDEHGYISRQFSRKYVLPSDVEPDKVVSRLNPNGALTIEAPKKHMEPIEEGERAIPITMETPAAVKDTMDTK
jgi:crystallin alpha B